MIQTTDPGHKGRYDAIRCGTCGRLWNEHTAECSRHAYRPGVEPEPEAADVERITARIPLRITGREERNGAANRN